MGEPNSPNLLITKDMRQSSCGFLGMFRKAARCILSTFQLQSMLLEFPAQPDSTVGFLPVVGNSGQAIGALAPERAMLG